MDLEDACRNLGVDFEALRLECIRVRFERELARARAEVTHWHGVTMNPASEAQHGQAWMRKVLAEDTAKRLTQKLRELSE